VAAKCKQFFGCIMYADDLIILLSSSVSGLQAMLICMLKITL